MEHRITVKEMLEQEEEADRKRYPYHVTSYTDFTSKYTTSHETSEDLWTQLFINHRASLFRGSIRGLMLNSGPKGNLIPAGEALQPGDYISVLETKVDDETMSDLIEEAVEQLKKQRHILDQKKLRDLEMHLLATKFTHSSVVQEGSTISLEETELLANVISQQDPMHTYNDHEMSDLVEMTTSSEREVIEVVNHQQVINGLLIKYIKGERFTEEGLLETHKKLMERLLTNEKEGKAGEYRKVRIQVGGSKVKRTLPEDIQLQMDEFFADMNKGPNEYESFNDYLARIHTKYQIIHPFRDGNGRIGRIILNILSLQQGYPMIFFSPDNSGLFVKACERSNLGNKSLMSRMILEAFSVALREYEKIMEVKFINEAHLPK